MAKTNRVIVIGGGISGLACAHRLKRQGADVMLLEWSDHAGGLIGSVQQNGFLFEHGPQSFQGTSTLLDLIRELAIESELLEANPSAPRYVLRRGRLRRVPMSPPALIGSSLLGIGSRWKIVSEPFRRTSPPGHEESVAEFVRRKFGHEILEYLVSPFVSGVYAGDPERLSLRAAFPTLEEWERQFGSVLRGAMKSRPANGEKKALPLCSFRRGIATLTNALARDLGVSVRTGVRAERLTKVGSGAVGFEIHFVENGQNTVMNTAAVVLATPAYVSARLVASVSPQIAQLLSGIAYAPVAVTAAGYYSKQLKEPPDGFGFLVPRKEKLRTLGTVWNSSLFPGRAPHARFLMTSFLGGATDPALIQKSESEIAAIANGENQKILQIIGEPIASATWRYEKALPQYNLGHGHTIERLREATAELPGVWFSGNYLEGPSIGKCVDQAIRTADQVGERTASLGGR
ncbi:MAG: protoporphyrinogen oxidase [Candidatus Acidiferrales bacterium]